MAAVALKRLMPTLRPYVADHDKGRSMRAARALLYDGSLGNMERMFLAAMWIRAGASGICFTPLCVLADMIGSSRKGAQRSARSLVKRGLATERYVQRGEEMMPGVVAMSPRIVYTLKELPLVTVHGVDALLMQAFNPNLLMREGHNDKHMKTAPRAVLALLLVHANENSETIVGVERAAKLLRMNPRTAARHMQSLEKNGHLSTRLDRVAGPSGYPAVIRTLTPGCGQRFTTAISDKVGGQERPPKEIHQEDPLRAPTPPPPPGQLTFAFMTQKAPRVDQVAAAVLELHEHVCKARKSRDGDGAVELVKAMLSEGLTPRDLGKAFSGVMTMAYRRERLVRREIGAVIQTKAQAVSFIKRVDPERAEQIEKNAPAPPTKSELERIRQDVRHLCAAKRPDFSCR